MIGTVFGTSATNALAADDPFKNKVNIDTDEENKNSCDESDFGFNEAVCAITDNLSTETFSIQGEKNKISLDLEAENQNDCDESEDADNESFCIISTNKNIGPMVVGTTDTDTGTLIVTKNVLCATQPCAFEPEDFTILVTGNVQSSPNPFPGSATGTEVTLGPGSYSVTETDPIGGVTHTVGADCAGNINAGETKNCLITNSLPANTP